MESQVNNVFDNLIENLDLVCNQLKDGECNRPEAVDFSLDAFWIKLNGSVALVSKETTKLCVAFSKPPAPDPIQSSALIAGMEKATLTMVSAFYGLPKTQGLTLRGTVRDAVVAVTQAVQSLARGIKLDGAVGSPSQLQSTGSVWECCDVIGNLPKDNKEASIRIVRETAGLVRDALEEIEEAQKNDDDDESLDDDFNELIGSQDNRASWSEADKDLMASTTGLVKVSKSSIKRVCSAVKTHAQCDEESNISQLDDLVDRLRLVSPAVDDLISSLYPPMRHDAVKLYAETLGNVIKNLLEFSKHSHVTTEDDSSWLEFLLKANEHNLQKIRDFQDSS